jgi:hypothetical protein
MDRKSNFRILWATSLLVAASLACSLINRPGELLQEVQGTARSVATEFQDKQDLVATVVAIGTQVQGSGFVQTAGALATKAGESGLLETAAAYATRQGPSLLDTAQSFLTAEGPELQKTAQAFATGQFPGLKDTALAVATQMASSVGEMPADIPLVEGEKKNMLTSKEAISYLTTISFPEVVSFYQIHMPAYGWTKIEPGSVNTQNIVVMNYEKQDRKATVTLTINPLDKSTIVMIVVSPK